MFSAGLTLTGKVRRDHFRDLLRDLPATTDDGLRLQVLVATIEHDPNAIVAALPKLRQLIDTSGVNQPAEAAERRFDLVSVLLRRLLDDSRTREMVTLLRAWFGVEDLPYTDPVLVLSHQGDVRYTWEGGQCTVAPRLSDRDRVRTINSALGLALVSGVSPGPMPANAGTGATQDSDADALMRVTADLTGLDNCPQAVAALDAADADAVPLLIVMPSYPVPYQAAFAEHTDRVPVLWVSLQTPEPSPYVGQNVTIMLGAGTATGDLECRMLEQVFANGNFCTTVLAGDEATVSAFHDAWDDPELDLLWVASHGTQPAYMPNLAGLPLGEEEFVPVADMTRPLPSRDTTRLLMLNACDGAVTEVCGGPRRRGIAALAAAANQAVIAHQWRVAEPFAVVFGVLLAHGLSDNGITDAFSYALRQVREPWKSVASVMHAAGCRSDDIVKLRDYGLGIGGHGLDFAAPALYR